MSAGSAPPSLSWKGKLETNSYPERSRVSSVVSDDGDGDGDGINTRKANSTVGFDTMSNASLNTEDGAATYTNSEYTSHLVRSRSECSGQMPGPPVAVLSQSYHNTLTEVHEPGAFNDLGPSARPRPSAAATWHLVPDVWLCPYC